MVNDPNRTAVCDGTNDPAYVRLRAALDAITVVRRDGRYNTAEECREIARAALSSPEARKDDT